MKVIEKVTPDIKTAETLSLEITVDDAIHLSEMITEIYTGNPKGCALPLVVKEDSKALIDSLYSTKKVKRKTMRVVISCLQQYITNGIIKDIIHVKTDQQLADVFTKRGVNGQNIIDVTSTGAIVHNKEKDETEASKEDNEEEVHSSDLLKKSEN